MSPLPGPVAVVGAGSWGTTLATLLAKKRSPTKRSPEKGSPEKGSPEKGSPRTESSVRLWAHEREVADEIRDRRTNETYLEGVELPPGIDATHDLERAVRDAAVVVSVSPSQYVGGVMAQAAPHLAPDALVVSASKGIEISTLRRMEEVIGDHLTRSQRERFVALSGPSFAAEVAREMPTAVAVASRSEAARRRAQELFQTDYFRVYTNPDVVGVELGGALKNVVAVAAGVVSGLGFGHNTLAALVTRGLAEIRRLGVALGARASTFAGLAGIGDLMLTCTGDLSRNRTVGRRLGEGESLEEILDGMTAVAEGVETVRAVCRLARRHGVEMPISAEVHAILHEGRAPEQAVRNLMLREPKPEEWS